MGAGSVKDSGPAEGTFTLPYIADENADEDPELKVAVAGGNSKAAQQLREVFLTRGKQVCLAAHRPGPHLSDKNKVPCPLQRLRMAAGLHLCLCMPPQV